VKEQPIDKRMLPREFVMQSICTRETQSDAAPATNRLPLMPAPPRCASREGRPRQPPPYFHDNAAAAIPSLRAAFRPPADAAYERAAGIRLRHYFH